MNDMKVKRKTDESGKESWKNGSISAGLVTGSKHANNNVYLKLSTGKRHVTYDFTIDEAAAIIATLGRAICHYTSYRREILAPHHKR